MMRGSPTARHRQLRHLLGEVADIDWRHPSWWLLSTLVTSLEGRGGTLKPDAAAYIHSDGGPRADTFMARRRGPAEDPAQSIAAAIVRARAGLDVLRALEGQFPGQRLHSSVVRRDGAWQVDALSTRQPNVLFVTGTRQPVCAVLAEDDATDGELAAALFEWVYRGRRDSRLTDPGALGVGAVLTVTIGDEADEAARHLHRRSWCAAGGPWLGLGTTSSWEVVSTCHLAVDGYAHARLCSEVFRLCDGRRNRQAGLVEVIRRAARGELLPLPGLGAASFASPLGVATTQLFDAGADFAALAHSLGRSLEGLARSHLPTALRQRFKFTPTFQVPVAPGDPTDPTRWRSRVLPALMSVRMRHGEFEPLPLYRARVRDLLARECAAQGLLCRVTRATANVPLPLRAKRRIVSSSTVPTAWVPAIEALAGRGCLSVLRFPESEAPPQALVAVSAPALDAAPADPLGGLVLTAIGNRGRISVTVSGTGATGSNPGAARFLDGWMSNLRECARDA